MMQKRISRLCALIMCCFCLISAIPIGAQAAYPIRRPAPDQENDPTDPAAVQNISDKALIANQTGFDSLDFLFDGGKYLGRTTEENASLTLSHPDGIGSLYFIF